MWDVITYPFLNFNGCTVEVQEWISNFIPHILGMKLLIHAGIRVDHDSKSDPWAENSENSVWRFYVFENKIMKLEDTYMFR